MLPAEDFSIDRILPEKMKNPILVGPEHGYITEGQRLLYKPTIEVVRGAMDSKLEPASFEIAGPRGKIAIDPKDVRAAIVTCGGICPGLNAVIRGLVMQLWYRYGVKYIQGVRFGYGGLGKSRQAFMTLEPDTVVDIHEKGGTILGSSRGSPHVNDMVDTLVSEGINMLFTVGGDGTMRGALAISQEIKKRNLPISVIGIPKTIDNDIPYVKRSFGFETAVAVAAQAIGAAHNEATSVMDGIGLVKLMGRHSGYVAASTALATGHANICLIPEVPFKIEGETGLLRQIEARLDVSKHCLIIVAEGAGQQYFSEKDAEYDSSGNKRLGDIGTFLKEEIKNYFQKKNRNAPIRYIDPSYLIRAAAANPDDVLFCAKLAQNAVHAAMAGRTAMLIGHWHGQFTHIPMRALANKRRSVDPHGDLWFTVLETTGQAERIGV